MPLEHPHTMRTQSIATRLYNNPSSEKIQEKNFFPQKVDDKTFDGEATQK